MKPELKREVDALLADLWRGTPIDVALAEASLVITAVRDEELTEADIDRAVERAFDWVRAEIGHFIVTVKQTFDGDPFAAIALDQLLGILADYDMEGD